MALKILAATRKGLFTLARNGKASAPWTIERSDFLADNVSLVLHDKRSGKIYAALDHGHFGVKMHRADGPGGEWSEQVAPAYPPKPETCEEKDMWGNPLPWNTVRIWGLEQGGPEFGVLWCGTIPGGLFRSEDHGASWQMIHLALERSQAHRMDGPLSRLARPAFDLRRPAKIQKTSASASRRAASGKCATRARRGATTTPACGRTTRRKSTA